MVANVNDPILECPLCGLPLPGLCDVDPETELYDVMCERCAHFKVERWLLQSQRLSPDEEIILSGLARRTFDPGFGARIRVFRTDDYKQQLAAARVPRDAVDQVDELLALVAGRAPHMADFSSEDSIAAWAARLYLPSAGNFLALVRSVAKGDTSGKSVVEWPNPYRPESGVAPLLIARHTVLEHESVELSQNIELSLTLEGWAKLRELREVRDRESRQAFVAMAFQEPMFDVYAKAIKPAIEEDSELTAYLVGERPTDDKIHDDVMAAIRRSRFVVADVTFGKPNVYFEAGFAKGLGIPVVWSCRADRRERDMHFDTRQFEHILWNSVEEFRDNLAKHILARGFDTH